MTNEPPRYGEYATPEQQRAAAGLPPVQPEQPEQPAAPAPTGRPQAVTGAGRRIDRIVTFALLGFGMVNVLSSVGGFMDLATTLDRTLQLLGLDGEFTNIQAAKIWGAIAAVVMLAGYILTVSASFRRLKTLRSAWWVPLAGFAVTMAIVSACIAVPMLGDPAFTAGMVQPPAG